MLAAGPVSSRQGRLKAGGELNRKQGIFAENPETPDFLPSPRHQAGWDVKSVAEQFETSAARTATPNIRWQNALRWPRTRRWRPPNSSSMRALARSAALACYRSGPWDQGF